MFYLTLNFNSDAIFVFPRVDLHNKILISSQNSDLEKSASSTARPKFQRPRGRPRRVLSSSKSVCDLPIGSHSCDNRRRGIWKGFRIRAHPTVGIPYRMVILVKLKAKEFKECCTLKKPLHFRSSKSAH